MGRFGLQTWLLCLTGVFWGFFPLLSAAEKLPVLHCEQSEFDFGELGPDQIVHHTFVLENTGNAPLHILDVKPGCGCTVVEIGCKQIAPGARTELRTRLSTKGMRGIFRKRIAIRSNATGAPRTYLWLTGSVVYALTLEPVHVDFGGIKPDAEQVREVTLSGREKDGVNITAVRTDSPVVRVEREVGQAGRCEAFLIRTVPPLSTGPLRAIVRVATDHPKHRHLEVTVGATVLSEVRVIPRALVFRDVSTRPAWRVILLLPGSVKKFHVLSVAAPAKPVEVNVDPLPGGGLKIVLKDLRVGPGLDGKVVLIKTDLPQMKEIEVPIRVVR